MTLFLHLGSYLIRFCGRRAGGVKTAFFAAYPSCELQLFINQGSLSGRNTRSCSFKCSRSNLPLYFLFSSLHHLKVLPHFISAHFFDCTVSRTLSRVWTLKYFWYMKNSKILTRNLFRLLPKRLGIFAPCIA